MPALPRNRNVVALVYEGGTLFELSIALEIFGLSRPEIQLPWYRLAVVGVDPSAIPSPGGIRIEALEGTDALRRAGTIIVPGWSRVRERPPDRLLEIVRSSHDRGARVVSICGGAFVLAAAGLLDGRRATAHWMHVELLRSMYPKVDVEPNVLYVDAGNVLTSAGSAAGIDLCLHLVRRDYGSSVASVVARRLVVSPHREGGQLQYVQDPLPKSTATSLAPVLEWAMRRLHEPLSVEQLARRADVSPRTFARRFLAETGTTPHRWLTLQRLITAQRRLETSDHSVDQIAESVGFDSAGTLRHHFRLRFGTTPTSYRRRFSLGRFGRTGDGAINPFREQNRARS